ncbi:hypothetical protein [Streptomyces sp. Ag82_O1-15]|uniref:hypothetical protein n=1 Tax=Streptomyces sp. Ag82_O1-15 TaxID=1938855 RepID=UPI00211C61A6|nr:hypothetical protein [Streptomyces sp. Ag82_O1-15]
MDRLLACTEEPGHLGDLPSRGAEIEHTANAQRANPRDSHSRTVTASKVFRTQSGDHGAWTMSRTVRLELTGLPDTDEDELRWLSSQLRRSLLELDVADVRLARSSSDVPSGAKSSELIAAGTVIVTAAPFILRQVLQLVDTWLKNRPVRGIKVDLDGHTIELSDASVVERERLIDAFLAHREPADTDETDTEQSQPLTS